MDYKKILEGIVDIINTTEKSDIGFANICTYIGEKCPELQDQESEDEKIRKWLIDWANAVNWSEQFTITKEQVLAWLEKQGAQKPETWCAEDEQNLNVVLSFISDECLRRWLKDKLCYDMKEAGYEWDSEKKELKKIKMKSFNVLTWDFNGKDLTITDVLPYFRDEYKRAKKNERPQTINEWKEFIKRRGMCRYWSRCEYEIIVSPWPAQNKSVKIDVWDQINSNIDIIAEILYGEHIKQ